MAATGVQYFSSPETEAVGKAPAQGQAAYSEQDEFHDPQGKYKLVMKGMQRASMYPEYLSMLPRTQRRLCAGAYAAVECAVLPGDSIKAESGAMVTMSNNIDLDVKVEGSAGAALVRCCFAGESLFMSHFSLKPGMVRPSNAKRG